MAELEVLALTGWYFFFFFKSLVDNFHRMLSLMKLMNFKSITLGGEFEVEPRYRSVSALM